MAHTLRLGRLIRLLCPVVVVAAVLSGLAHPSLEGKAIGCAGGPTNASGSKFYYVEPFYQQTGVSKPVATNAPLLLAAVYHELSADEVLAKSQVVVRDSNGMPLAGKLARAGRIKNPSYFFFGAEAALLLWRPDAPLTAGATYSLTPDHDTSKSFTFQAAAGPAEANSLSIGPPTLWEGKKLGGAVTTCQGTGGCDSLLHYPFGEEELDARWITATCTVTQGVADGTQSVAALVVEDLDKPGDPLLVVPDASMSASEVLAYVSQTSTPACTTIGLLDLIDATKSTSTQVCSDQPQQSPTQSPLQDQLTLCGVPPEDPSMLDAWCLAHSKQADQWPYTAYCKTTGTGGTGGQGGGGQGGGGMAGSAPAGAGGEGGSGTAGSAQGGGSAGSGQAGAAGQSSAGQAGAAQGGSPQGGAGEGGANQAGSSQAGANQAGASQAGASQAGGGQAGQGQAGSGQQAEATPQVMDEDGGCSTAGAGRGKAGLGAMLGLLALAALGRKRRR